MLKVNCGDRPCDGENCSTAEPPEVDPDFECTADGFYADPDNCIKFYQCAGDSAIHNTCPVDPGSGVQELYDPDNAW